MSDSSNYPEKQQRHNQPKKWSPPQLLGALYNEMKKHAVNQPDSDGQTVGALAKLIAKNHPSLGLTSPSKNKKTIGTYIEHLKEFGHETKMFTIEEFYSEKDKDCNRVLYKYTSAVSPCLFRLMYESCSKIKGVSDRNREDILSLIKAVYNTEFAQSCSDLRPNNAEKMIEMTSVLEELYSVIDKINFESKKMSRVHSLALIEYSSYNERKKLASLKTMTVFPLKIVIYMGACYLICVEKRKKQLLRLRIDRITQVNCQRDKNGTEADFIKKLDSVKSPYGDTLFMCQGKEYEISISFDKEHINEVLDWFGMNIVIGNDGNGRYSATVFATKEGIIRLALMYSDWLKVTGPDRAVNEIKKAIRYAAKGYDMYKKSEK